MFDIKRHQVSVGILQNTVFHKKFATYKKLFILKMFKKVVYNEKRMGIIPVVDSDICQLSKAGRRNGIEITSRDISNTTFAILV